ncbi:hypothetical protein ABK040_007360 [Willaertia magna]
MGNKGPFKSSDDDDEPVTPKKELKPVTPKKLLLIGAGDSGKSTIFRQLRRLFGGVNEIPAKERAKATEFIIENIIRNMICLCRALRTETLENGEHYSKEKLQNPNLDPIITSYLEFSDESILNAGQTWRENPEMGNNFIELWKEPSIKYCFDSYRTQYQVEESAPYYFNDLERINKSDYLPLEEDILRTRIKTTGIIEQEFVYNNQPFTLIDVGGQRNERRKWLHQFQNVDAILYVCSLSEFDQSCYEDNTTNRMKESLELFSNYIASKHFEGVAVYLLFNKQDIFENKIKKGRSLKNTFPDYDGDASDFEKSKHYVENLYKEKDTLARVRQTLYMVALDKENLKQNIENIVNDIITLNVEI